MSVENGKVCCNCRHNIRRDEGGDCINYCDVDRHYIGYLECMTGCCGLWGTEADAETRLMSLEPERREE